MGCPPLRVYRALPSRSPALTKGAGRASVPWRSRAALGHPTRPSSDTSTAHGTQGMGWPVRVFLSLESPAPVSPARGRVKERQRVPCADEDTGECCHVTRPG